MLKGNILVSVVLAILWLTILITFSFGKQGAVVTPNFDPVMVMEYMEYGSLHDLLRNETMYLSGEIILQITRDVS